MEIFAKVEDSVVDITNRCFPDATALAVRLEDLDQTDQEDFYSRVGSIHRLFIHYFLEKFGNKYKVIIALMGLFSQIMKTPSQTPGLTDYEDSCPTYPTPVVSPEISTAVADKKAKTPRSSRTNDNLVTLSENDGEGPKQKSPRLDEPEINMTVVDDPGDGEEGGEEGDGEDEGEEENPWDDSCLPEDAVSFLQQVPPSCQ